MNRGTLHHTHTRTHAQTHVLGAVVGAEDGNPRGQPPVKHLHAKLAARCAGSTLEECACEREIVCVCEERERKREHFFRQTRPPDAARRS
jgi:hypothetical protein